MKIFLAIWMGVSLLLQPAAFAAENAAVTAASEADKAADDFLLKADTDVPDSLEKAEAENEDVLIVDETDEQAAEDKALETMEDKF